MPTIELAVPGYAANFFGKSVILFFVAPKLVVLKYKPLGKVSAYPKVSSHPLFAVDAPFTNRCCSSTLLKHWWTIKILLYF
jgi:hypothetical protein